MRRGRATAARDAKPFAVEIEALGFRGDGIAAHGGRRLLVPMALPGEVWQVRRRRHGEVVEPLACLRPSLRRAGPVCPHFGACGGCALQHLREDDYGELKVRAIRGALRARGIDPPLPIALHKSPLGSRRRLRLGHASGRLGFRRRLERELVEIAACPIARPDLVALFEPLRRLLRRLDAARPGGEVTLTVLDTGVEIVLHLAGDPGLADRQALADFAETADLVRLAITVAGAAAEPVAVRRPPTLSVAGVPLTVPPGAFLQATRDGERALQDFATKHLGGAGCVVDLFCGLGTFALALAEAGAAVRAFELDSALVDACRHARVAARRRDLFSNPLQVDELDGVDAVVLDPPRAGAEAQVRTLAESPVPRVVYASCDPASFARDAQALAAGGYRISELLAVDQFLFSPEVELIAAFERVDP